MKRTAGQSADSDFVVIGHGSYNCAILVSSEGKIRRITAFAKIRDQEDKEDYLKMLRAREMLKKFNQHRMQLGPSVLLELKPGGWVDGRNLSDDAVRWMKALRCDPLTTPMMQRSEYMFYIQDIEYARGGDLQKFVAPDNMKDGRFAFFLIWFFYVAQAQFGFRHRDFKPENVVLRKYGSVRHFRFHMGEMTQFLISTNVVPVVIDLDMGSFFTSRDTARKAWGTYPFMPAEVTYHHMFTDEFDADDEGDEDVDWYSLGMTLFMYWVGSVESRTLYQSFGVERLVLNSILETSDWDDAKQHRKHHCHAFLLHLSIASAFQMEAPEGWEDIFEKVEQSGVYRRPLYKKIVQYVSDMRTKMPNHYTLLRKLMALKRTDRHYRGKPYMLLTEQPLFRKFINQMIPNDGGVVEEFAYGKFRILDYLENSKNDEDRRRFDRLVADIGTDKLPDIYSCIGCSAETRKTCECCMEPFCSVSCQKMYH